jgi:hypothetical protein
MVAQQAGSNNIGNCKTETDSVTHRIVYTSVDILPTNEGGLAALRKTMERNLDMDLLISDSLSSNIVVAFIVDKDGSIKGERIVNDHTGRIGQQMLDIVKTFKWIPGKCNGSKVATVYAFPVTVCVLMED